MSAVDNTDPRKKLDPDSPPELDKVKKWRGVYRGVRYEINNFSLGEGSTYFKDCWTHYIILNIDEQLKPGVREAFWLKTVWRDGFGKPWATTEYGESPLASLEWHGGITFYNREAGDDGGDRWIKAGCDYQHLWDEGHKYSVEYVYQGVKETIDSLWEAYGLMIFLVLSGCAGSRVKCRVTCPPPGECKKVCMPEGEWGAR